MHSKPKCDVNLHSPRWHTEREGRQASEQRDGHGRCGKPCPPGLRWPPRSPRSPSGLLPDGVHLTRALRRMPQLWGLPKPPSRSRHKEHVRQLPAKGHSTKPLSCAPHSHQGHQKRGTSEQLSRPEAAPTADSCLQGGSAMGPGQVRDLGKNSGNLINCAL